MQPFDYRLAVQNPVQMALAGYQQGQQMVGQREEAAMNRELFALKKQEFEAGQAKLAQEQARAQEVQAVLANYAEKMRDGTATADDAVYVMNFAPELAEQIQASWTLKDDANKQATKKEMMRLGAALKFSPEDVAPGYVETRIAALRENGNPEDLAAAETIKGYLDMGMPEAALASISLYASNVMEPEEWEAFSGLIMPKRPEAVGEIGAIIQNWQNGYYEEFYGPEKAREMAEADMKAAREGRPLVTNIVGGELSPGFKKRVELFAQTALDWDTGGGSDALKQLVQIEDVIGRIDRGENVSGGISGFSPDLVRAFADPNAQDAKDTVEEVVQRNLKAILGAQFTAQESGELIKRAFNARLSPEINRKRLQRLFTQMRLAAEQKQSMVEFFNTNGTLQGYQGKQPSMSDFYTAIEGTDAGVPTVTTDEQYDALPSGTIFVDDEGIRRKKP